MKTRTELMIRVIRLYSIYGNMPASHRWKDAVLNALVGAKHELGQLEQ